MLLANLNVYEFVYDYVPSHGDSHRVPRTQKIQRPRFALVRAVTSQHFDTSKNAKATLKNLIIMRCIIMSFKDLSNLSH